ncbi:MAG: hypothetical protein KAT56_04730 [Sedimentisphaerales bacterium]|nr:hypothetical protein [Sedimentisphaerales bacterium]
MTNGYYYNLIPINLDDIKKLETEFRDRLDIKMMPYDVRPFRIRPDFKDTKVSEEGLSWDKFVEVFVRYQNKIRKYTFALTEQKQRNITGRKYEITIRIKENAYETTPHSYYPSIEILAWQEEDCKFDRIRKVFEETWGLSFSEYQLQIDLLSRYSHSIKNEELKDKISKAMVHHDYDLAMSAASVFVETKLREKCLSVGAALTKNQTGVDLATASYHEDKGCLSPPFNIADRASQGVLLIFQGFFHYIRNAYGHNTVIMGNDRECIIEYLNFCETLLKIIETSTKR